MFAHPSPAVGRLPSLGLVFAASAAPGWRVTMEDATAVAAPLLAADGATPLPIALFATFDGHGGATASFFLAAHFAEVGEGAGEGEG